MGFGFGRVWGASAGSVAFFWAVGFVCVIVLSYIWEAIWGDLVIAGVVECMVCGGGVGLLGNCVSIRKGVEMPFQAPSR